MQDSVFANAQALWQNDAAAMFALHTEAPRPSVWSAIEARLPANDRPTHRVSRATLLRWQAGAVAASAAALALAAVAMQKPAQIVLRVPMAQVPAAPMVAVLTGKQGLFQPQLRPRDTPYDLGGQWAGDGDHAAELWVIPRRWQTTLHGRDARDRRGLGRDAGRGRPGLGGGRDLMPVKPDARDGSARHL